jgi:hypothetical protein
MLFFLDMHRVHTKMGILYPDWFIFSDDDYYIRLHALEALLQKHSEKHTKYGLKAFAERAFALIPGSEYAFGQQGPIGYGLGVIFDKNCTVPCVHQMPWMGFGGFSIGALR